jgi:hypothetical protein
MWAIPRGEQKMHTRPSFQRMNSQYPRRIKVFWENDKFLISSSLLLLSISCLLKGRSMHICSLDTLLFRFSSISAILWAAYFSNHCTRCNHMPMRKMHYIDYTFLVALSEGRDTLGRRSSIMDLLSFLLKVCFSYLT